MDSQMLDEGACEDLLTLWSDLEGGVAHLLEAPDRVDDLPERVQQYDRWIQALLLQDTDTALYLLFQLAGALPARYSTAHAMVCAAVSHLAAAELQLPAAERASLVAAALTMNIAMTAEQDELAHQPQPPSTAQRHAIAQHPQRSRALLAACGVADPLWLDVVARHADDDEALAASGAPGTTARLARLLRVVDRYAAMLSPRRTRAGRTATDSMRAVVSASGGQRDDISYAVVRAVGLCPPGTYVRLDNGDTAVVLRRGPTVNQPLVASLLGAQGERYPQPRLHSTASGLPRIQAALSHQAMPLELNHHMMVRLGLYAAARLQRGGSASGAASLHSKLS